MSKGYEKVAGIFDTVEQAEKFCKQVELSYPSKEDVDDIEIWVIQKILEQ